MRRSFQLLVVLAPMLLADAAFAQDRHWPSQSRDPGAQSEAAPPHNCYCRAAGSTYEMGTATCLAGHIAICNMQDNVSSWTITKNACPVTNLMGPHLDADRPHA
jgi:hypothetical protein